MKFTETELPGVLLIEPKRFDDERGFFMETFHAAKFAEAGLNLTFVQDNHSRSKQGVLRGLHYQLERPQGKLVRVVRGEIFDVAVDLRRSSPTFVRWFGIRLSADDQRMIYIPPGFAHGLYAISDLADVTYKCTELYHPQSERTLLWNDPVIGIQWPTDSPQLSSKDATGTLLCDAECFD